MVVACQTVDTDGVGAEPERTRSEVEAPLRFQHVCGLEPSRLAVQHSRRVAQDGHAEPEKLRECGSDGLELVVGEAFDLDGGQHHGPLGPKHEHSALWICDESSNP